MDKNIPKLRDKKVKREGQSVKKKQERITKETSKRVKGINRTGISTKRDKHKKDGYQME